MPVPSVSPLSQKGATRLLDACIDNQNKGIKGKITRFLHLSSK